MAFPISDFALICKMDKTDDNQTVRSKVRRVNGRYFFLVCIYTHEHAAGIAKMSLEDVTVSYEKFHFSGL